MSVASSAYYPQSNGWAEAAVKTSKHIIKEHIGNNSKIAQGLLQYRNTPLKEADVSPAQFVMGRNLRDFIPQPPSGYRVSNKWQHFLRQRELTMKQNNDKQRSVSKNNLSLGDLPIGTEVLCQNTCTNQWDRSGIVVKCCGFRQYEIKVHGSGRITTRNRIHLRRVGVFIPVVVQTKVTHGDVQSELSVSERENSEISSEHPISDDYLHQENIDNYLRRSGKERRAPNRYGDWENK